MGAVVMNIIAENENVICIELTREDMCELDITYDELDYANIETRRVLWTLLDEARHKLGKDIRLTQKMLIEAVPDSKGGCTIFFTVSDGPEGRNGKKQLVKVRNVKIICGSDNIDDISALSEVLARDGRVVKSELYTDGDMYRLIIYPETSYFRSIENVVCEYCDICEDDVTAYTYEHWKMLASPDAVGILSALS